MRKFTRFMLAALLCIVGKGVAQAAVITDPSQLSNDKVYRIRTARGNLILDFNETIVISTHSNNGNDENPNVSESQGADQFGIMNFDGLYYIYSPMLEKFASLNGETLQFFPWAGIGLTFDNGGLSEGYEGSTLRITDPGHTVVLNNNNSGSIVVNGWGATYGGPDAGNTLAIEEVDGVTLDVAKATEVFYSKPNVPWMDPHKVFYLSTIRAEYLTCDDESSTLLGNTLVGTIYYPDATEEEKQFAFYVDENNKMYLYNVGSNKFLDKTGHLTSVPSEVAEISYEPNDEEDEYNVVLYIKETKFRFNSQTDGTIKFNTFSSHDEGNIITIEEVPGLDVYDKMKAFFENEEYDITYHLMFNDQEIKTFTRPMTLGSNPTMPGDLILGTCDYESDTEIVESASDEVTVTVYWNGPEMFSNDFESATWYNLFFDRDDASEANAGRYYAWYEEGKEKFFPQKDPPESMLGAGQSQWAFVGSPYGVKIYNKTAGEGMTLWNGGTDANGAVVLVEGNEDDHIWTVGFEGDYISLGININGQFNYINQHGGASTNSYFGFWYQFDKGSHLSIEEAPDWLEVTDVYFDVYFNGELAVSEKVIGQELGEYIPELPASLNIGDLVEFDYDEDETIDEENQHVRIDAKWVGPFEISKDFGSAHWYDMCVRGNWYVTSDKVDADGALEPVEANATGLAEDSYQWAFVGDPWHIKLYNKAKGSGEVFAWTSKDNQAIPEFVDASTANVWLLKKSTNAAEEYADAFMLTVPNHNGQVNQFGGAGHSLKQWNADTTEDPGSAFKVFDVPTDFAEFVAKEIAPTMENEAKWFNFTDAARAQVGYKAEYKESCPFEAYKSMKLAIENLKNDVSNYLFPPTGFYRLKSKYYGDFFGLTSDQTMANPDGTAASTVVRLNKVGDCEYTIQAQNAYFQPLTQSESMITSETDPVTWKAFIVTPGFASFSSKPEYEEITAEEDETLANEFTYSFLHRRAQGDYVGWTKDADASMFQVIEAKTITVEVGPEGVGSLYVPFAVTAPEGVVPFSGKINGEEVQMTPIKGNIPASTPFVILADEGTYDFPIVADGAEVATVADNDLKGTYISYMTNGALVPLESGTDKAFGVAEEDMPANSAYIRPEDTSIDEFIMVFGDFTAIKGVEDKQESTMFDLSGRRVNKANKGVYIIDGKKMLVK